MTHTRVRPIHIVCVSILTAIATADARADVVESAVAHVGVGAGISFNQPSSNDGDSSVGAAFVYRWHTFHSHWGPTFGLDWHSTDFNHTFGAVNAPMGTLRTRALLAGFGYTQSLGRLSASASVSGGYSFNDFSVAGNAPPVLLGVSVTGSAVLEPSVSVWYDVFRHIGVGISAAYLVSRPDETLTTVTGSQVQELHADTFELVAGLTFGLWKTR